MDEHLTPERRLLHTLGTNVVLLLQPVVWLSSPLTHTHVFQTSPVLFHTWFYRLFAVAITAFSPCIPRGLEQQKYAKLASQQAQTTHNLQITMRDLRKQALESHKTMSRKARSRVASTTASKTTSAVGSPAQSRAASRVRHEHDSEDEDDFSDGTAWRWVWPRPWLFIFPHIAIAPVTWSLRDFGIWTH